MLYSSLLLILYPEACKICSWWHLFTTRLRDKAARHCLLSFLSPVSLPGTEARSQPMNSTALCVPGSPAWCWLASELQKCQALAATFMNTLCPLTVRAQNVTGVLVHPCRTVPQKWPAQAQPFVTMALVTERKWGTFNYCTRNKTIHIWEMGRGSPANCLV